MMKLKVRKIGNSLGVILPSEAAAALRVGEGDEFFLTEGPDGLRMTPYSPEFERQMKAGSRAMRKYRNALRELAR